MRKRNGVLRFWGALALCLCLCAGVLAESAQGYTVAEKLLKQLEAGSGFSGTLEVQTDGTDAPLSFQWDYIHTRKNSETVEQQRLDLRLMDGDTVRTTARFQWENPALRFQTDLWSDQWYELNLSRTEQAEGSVGASLNARLSAALKDSGIPVSFLRMLPLFSSLNTPDEWLAPALETCLTRMDIWMEGYRGSTELGKLEDGTGTVSTQYRIAPSNVKAQLKQLILDVLADDDLIQRLKNHFGEEQAAQYLNPEWQPYYFAAVDALPLEGDLVIDRRVSLKGDLLSLKISMPYSDPELGAVTLGCSLTTAEDSEPNTEITIESQERLVALRYFTYSSVTDVSVTQGTLISQPVGEAAYTVAEGEQEKPLAIAFLYRRQVSTGQEEDGRDNCRIQLELSLTPDQETTDAQEFDEYDLNLDMTFASRSPQKAATELNAVLTVGGGQQTGRTFTLNGTTRTPWVPEAVPAGAVSLSDLPESDWTALVQQMLSDSLTAQPAGES